MYYASSDSICVTIIILLDALKYLPDKLSLAFVQHLTFIHKPHTPHILPSHSVNKSHLLTLYTIKSINRLDIYLVVVSLFAVVNIEMDSEVNRLLMRVLGLDNMSICVNVIVFLVSIAVYFGQSALALQSATGINPFNADLEDSELTL